MMLSVGICDDCAEHAALLEKYIGGYPGGETLQIVKSTDPQRFLEIVRELKPRLVFLDIDMDGLDGIELGEKIKSIIPDAAVIYVTAHEKYALEAFRVRAFHYLLKPVSRENVWDVLTEALAFIKRSCKTAPDRVFTVQRKGETISLPMADIACFEKVGHKIRVHIAVRSEEYYGNFTQLLEQIGNAGFIQCHQGYIVSVAKIRSFREKTLYLSSGMQVPVSRTYTERVREALAKRLFAGKDNT